MRFKPLLALSATTGLLLAGCGAESEPDDSPPPENENFPITLGDLTLDEQPTRIISLAPAVTEILFAIDAGDQVVAVDEFSTYPPEAPTTDLSGFTPNVEAIASYDPDLVLISYDPDGLSDGLDAIGVPTYLVPDDEQSIGGIFEQITDVGLLTGHIDQATELVDRMSDDLAELVSQVPARDEPLTYYFEIDSERYTYTSHSWVGELLSMAQLENIADDEAAVTQLGVESIVDANPDLIFLANTAYGVDADVVTQRDGWADIEAVQAGQIVELDSDIASRWGPRIVDLLETVVDAVTQVP